jgi:uncharacterized protein (DUF1501 family)
MAPRNCCNEFTRARFLQRSAATAGSGLPAIEAGMPAPAGTGLSRRTFLSRSLGAALAVYGGSQLGIDAFEEGIANAAADPSRVLVSVFMGGGMDGMSVLAPVGDAKYASLRPTLATAVDGTRTFAEDPTLQWTTAADSLRTLHGEGKVTVMPAIGYDHPNQSHFTSRHFWEVGELSVDGGFGWLGRFLDQHGVADNPLQGLSMNSYLSPGLAAAQVPVASVYRPDQFGLFVPGVSDPILGSMYSAIGGLGGLPSSDGAIAQARLVATEVDSIRSTLLPYQGNAVAHSTAYPNGDFGRKLEVLAAMVAANVPVRAVSVDAPGAWDSHADQAATIGPDVKNAFDTLLAFQRDLEARVRPPPAGERRRHRPRRRGDLVRHRLQGQGPDGRRVPGPVVAGPGQQPEGHQRLPRRVLLAAGAVVRRRRGADHPGRIGLRAPDAGGVGGLDAVVVGVQAVVVGADDAEGTRHVVGPLPDPPAQS